MISNPCYNHATYYTHLLEKFAGSKIWLGRFIQSYLDAKKVDIVSLGSEQSSSESGESRDARKRQRMSSPGSLGIRDDGKMASEKERLRERWLEAEIKRLESEVEFEKVKVCFETFHEN